VGNVLSKSVTGLTANTTYFYRVRAVNAGGTSGNSNTITVNTLPNAPAAPTANAATNITGSSFTANWSSSSGATGYRLDVSTSNTFSSFVSGYQDLDVGNVLSGSVTGLSANTAYFYRVRAYNTGGTSGNSNTINVTTSMTGPTIFVDSVTGELAAIDSITFVRGPFTLTDNYNFSSDNHTRIIFFTTDLGLPQTFQPNTDTLSVQLDGGGTLYPVEIVGPNAVIGGSYIVFRLPDSLTPGLHSLAIRLNGANGVSSTNSPTFMISQP
jgi:hypothetical protein